MSDQQPKFGAGSLYGGISFSDQAAQDAAGGPPKEEPKKSELNVLLLSSLPSQAGTRLGRPRQSESIHDADTSLRPPRSDWSASLAFAPPTRRPQAKLKPPRASAALYFNPTPGVASSSNPTDAVRQAEPVIRLPVPAAPIPSTPDPLNTSYSPPFSSTSLPPPRPLFASSHPAGRALPSLTLEDDVNGFKKRPGGGGGGGGGRYGNNGGKKRKKQTAGPAFDPHEMYDPSRPNDVLEYKRWREEEKKRKERARKEKREQAAQAAQRGGRGGGGPGSDSEGSYYSEDEREELASGGFGCECCRDIVQGALRLSDR